MPANDVLESIPAEFGPPDRREERIAVGTGTFPDPGLQDIEGFPSQRRAPLLAPLALAADMGPRAGHDVAAAHADQFRGRNPVCRARMRIA